MQFYSMVNGPAHYEITDSDMLTMYIKRDGKTVDK